VTCEPTRGGRAFLTSAVEIGRRRWVSWSGEGTRAALLLQALAAPLDDVVRDAVVHESDKEDAVFRMGVALLTPTTYFSVMPGGTASRIS
jgi:hypothetical protein